MAKKYRTVKLEEDIIALLNRLKHPGQSLNGIIQELLVTRLKLGQADEAIQELLEKVKKE